MRSLILVVAVLGLAGCGESNSHNTTVRQSVATDDVTEPVKLDDVTEPVKLTDRDLIRACKAGATFRGGRSVQGINAKVMEEQQVYLAYTRDDGKKFRYDCLVEGGVLKFRMVDEAGPGTGPGGWSGRGSLTTFKLNSTSVEINEHYMGEAESVSKTFNF